MKYNDKTRFLREIDNQNGIRVDFDSLQLGFCKMLNHFKMDWNAVALHKSRRTFTRLMVKLINLESSVHLGDMM